MRRGKGKGRLWGQPAENPQAKTKLTPQPERAGGRAGGWLILLNLASSAGPEPLFPQETKGPQLWRPAPLGGRFAPRDPCPEAGATGHSGLRECRTVGPVITPPNSGPSNWGSLLSAPAEELRVGTKF